MKRQGGAPERWPTPVSDARSLAMVALSDGDGLRVTLQDRKDPARRRFEFIFQRVAAYRNILEEYRLGESSRGPGVGWTAVLHGSSWLKELRKEEPLLDVHLPGCRHYVIFTEDDVLDIVAAEPPEIRELEPAEADEDVPGKSTTLYFPEDKEKIDRLKSEVPHDHPD